MNHSLFSSWVANFPFSFIKPLVMGIVNVTEDSFSDGGAFIDPAAALAHAQRLIGAGADVIDIGGESTRPGADALSVQEELDRVIPVISALRQRSEIAISIDTYKPEVMTAAVLAGATLINDTRALQMPGALQAVRTLKVPVCLMHSKGTPKTMQDQAVYPMGLIETLAHFFEERMDACVAHGISQQQILIDPGFGFAKQDHHNLELTKRLQCFTRYRRPIMYGASRKSTIGRVLNVPVEQRLFASIGLACYAVREGAAIVRVHDVFETKQALEMIYYVARECENDKS